MRYHYRCFRTKWRYLHQYFGYVLQSIYKFTKRCTLSAMMSALVTIIHITMVVFNEAKWIWSKYYESNKSTWKSDRTHHILAHLKQWCNGYGIEPIYTHIISKKRELLKKFPHKSDFSIWQHLQLSTLALWIHKMTKT